MRYSLSIPTFQLMRVLPRSGKNLFIRYRYPYERRNPVRNAAFDKGVETWMPAFALIMRSSTESFRLICSTIFTMFLMMPAYSLAEVTVDEVKEAVLKELSQSRVKQDTNVFNPAMGVVLDAVVKDTKEQKGGFEFRSAEINLQSAIDPFGRLYVIMNGTDEGLEVEEAAVITTALPAKLTLRFGRYFANFGRLPKFHEHELPFVNRTTSLTEFLGETRADGAELTHLFSTPFFLQGSLGVSNEMGGHDHDDESADHAETNEQGRSWSEFTYNARLFTYLPLGDNHGFDIGVSEAFIPKQPETTGFPISGAVSNQKKFLTGMDITYRYEPLQNNSFRKITLGVEVFNNQAMFNEPIDDNDDEIIDRVEYWRQQAWGGVVALEARLWRQYGVGGFYDYAEDPENNSSITRSGGVFANFFPSEFQRLRLQYSSEKNNGLNAQRDNQVYFQWMAVIGKHAHTFKDR